MTVSTLLSEDEQAVLSSNNIVVCPDGVKRHFNVTSGQTGRVRFLGKSVKGFNVGGIFVPDVTAKNGSIFKPFGSPIETD